MDQKLEYLEDANQILSESINVDSDRNWFAYTTRMQVRLDIADIDSREIYHSYLKQIYHSVLGNMPCLTLLEDFVNTG
jgi:hypothetical protein